MLKQTCPLPRGPPHSEGSQYTTWQVAFQNFLRYLQYVHTHIDLFCILVKTGSYSTICFFFTEYHSMDILASI